MQHDVQPPLGGHLIGSRRYECDSVRLDRLSDPDHLARCGHLHVQMRADSLLKYFDISILHVTPVAAKMHGDALSAGKLAEDRRGYRVGLIRLASLPDGGDVVDVDSETHGHK